MNLIPIYFRRRLWILRHLWLSELTLTLLLPVGIYVSIAAGLNSLVGVSQDGIPFRDWVVPGLVFVIALIAAYFPVFVEIFENRKIHPFLESVAASPNSSLTIVTAFTVSLLPEVIVKSLAAGVIVQLLGGSILRIFPFFGLMFFVLILGALVINLAFTVTILTSSSVLNLFVAFLISFFVVFASGWIVPIGSFPPSLSSFFSFLPTAQLLEGGRKLLFHNQVTFLTWLVPLGVSLVWIILNSILFRKVNTV
ncbi:MAG: hypothetical protein V3U24_03005 [Candidatus Neomarinimicrobiota bacterium]